MRVVGMSVSISLCWICQVAALAAEPKAVAPEAAPKRVWQLEDPLYEELFSDEPAGLAREGSLYWFHGMHATAFAQRYGMRYVFQEQYQENAAHRLFPFANVAMLETPVNAMPEFAKQTGLRYVLLPGQPSFAEPAENTGPEGFLTRMRRGLEKFEDVLWGVACGDEAEDHNILETIARFNDPAKVTPALRAVDQEIREKYGYGQFGIPASKTEVAPLKWIALYRYMNDRAVAMLQEIRREVKAKNPQLKVVSFDPMAHHYPFDFSRWTPECDILTHQLYPRMNPHRADFGFLTKLVKDISGAAEVWPCPHIENYPASFTPEECLELLSQVFRNGGTGLHYFLGDTMGSRGSKTQPNLIFERFGAPDRWQLEMAVAREAGRMKKLKFPQPDFAILYSCDSYSTMPNLATTDEAECCYTFVGPVARSWFTFIDDNQVERGHDLSAFKAIYLPLAKYERKSVVEALEAYVRQGGVLICGDPEAFSVDRDGSSLAELRQRLLGVTLGQRGKQATMTVDGQTLPVFDGAYALTLSPETETLGRFADGSPAFVSHTLGKGRVLSFAANPFTLKGLADPAWKAFFKTFQTQLGLKTGHDIWRFQFPKSLIPPLPAPEGKCLTNNHILWRGCQPNESCNLDTQGTYRYSLAPDAVADVAADEIPFAQGKLTDRRQVLTRKTADGLLAANLPQTQNTWLVSWNRPDPFDLVFDFQKPREVLRVVFFFSGQLPEVTFAASLDGKEWKPLDIKAVPQEAGRDVFDQTVSGPWGSCRYVKLSFAARPAGKSLTLAEAEVWGLDQ